MKVNYVQESLKFDLRLKSMIHSQIVGVANPLCTLLRLIPALMASVIFRKKGVLAGEKKPSGGNSGSANAGVDEEHFGIYAI
jgi:hypothetical protein